MNRKSFLQKKEIKRAFLYRESAELPDMIASKEKAIQTLKGTTEDIVKEEDVQAKIQKIGDKIERSPLSDEHKKEVRKSFEEFVSLRARHVNDIDINMEIALETVFDDIQMGLDEFLEQEDVHKLAEKIRERINQRERADMEIRAREAEMVKTDKELEDLAKRQASITTKQLPELFERLAYYTKENEKWTFLDEEKIIKDTVSLINAAERISEKFSKKIQEVGIRKVLLQQEIYLLKYHKLTISEKNTDELLLEIYDELGDASPRELKEKIEEARKRAVMSGNASEFDKHLYNGRYSEALQALNAQNEELTRALHVGTSFSEYDVLQLHEKSKGKPNFGAGKFMKGGFAAGLLGQGYRSVQLREGSGSALLIRENEDGSLSYVPVIDTGEQIRMGTVSLRIKIISGERRQGVLKEHDELEKNVRRAISQNPNIQKVQKASSVIQQKVAPLYKLFQAGMEGGKTEDFVALAKRYAGDIQKSYNSGEIRDLRINAEQAKRDLEILSGFSVGVQDEFEKEISKYRQAMDQVIDAVDSPHLMRMCEQILRDDFTEDNFKSWFIKEGIVMLSAILVATAAVVITLGTCGLGGVAALALVAGIGTVGGMAGAEFGYLISEEVGESVYGETFQNRSFLGKYAGEEEIFNPETGKYEKITLKQVAEVYGQQFVMGFVMTFALLGLGQIAGQSLLKFAVRHEFSLGAKGVLSRLIYRLPKMRAREIDMLEKKGIKNILYKINREFLEELREEGLQSTANQIDGKAEFLVSVYNCLNGGKVELSLGKYAVVAEENRSVVNEEQHQIINTFSYHSLAETELTAEVKAKYEAEGFKVEVKDGEITCTKKMTGKGKKKVEYENVIVFRKTDENVHMRRIFAEGNFEEDGKSPAEKMYGLERGGDGGYTYDQFAPDGKMNLAEFLKRKGFEVSGDAGSGSFEATRDGQTVKFEQKGAQGVEQRSAEAEGAPRIDRTLSPTVSETVSERGVGGAESEIGGVEVDRTGEKPTASDEHDLPVLSQKTKNLIEQHVRDSQDGQTLSAIDMEARVKREWGDFIHDVEGVRELYGKSGEVYANILFDFDLNFSDQDGTPIKTWAERTAYARELVSEKRLALRASRVEDELQGIKGGYEYRIRSLPAEERGENDAINVLKQLLSELTPAQRALPPEERRALIRKPFYDRMGKISREVGRVVNQMENYFRQNPDATYEKAIEEARKYGFDNLPASARRKIKIGALRLERNRRLIETALDEFNPAELFQNIFGFEPHDAVTLDRRSPFVLYFVVSEVDLFRANKSDKIHVNFSRSQVVAYLKENHFTVGGFHTSEAGALSGLTGLVTLGKCNHGNIYTARSEAERILVHEERHALHKMLFSLGERYSELGQYSRMAEAARDDLYRRQPNMSEEEFLTVLSAEFPMMLDYYKIHCLENGKDEIIAYLRDTPDRSLEELEERLLKAKEEGGIYDYFANARTSILGGFRPEGSDVRERMYDEMAVQYRQEIKDAIRIATEVLYTAGSLEERHEFLAELSSTPVEAWSAVFDERVQMATKKRVDEVARYSLSKIHPDLADCAGLRGEELLSFVENFNRSHPSGVSADPFVPVYNDGQIIIAFDEHGMLVPFAGVDSINIARDSRYARYFPERDRFRAVANDDLDAIRRDGAIDDTIISIRLETMENIVRIPNIRIDEAIHAEALALVDEGLDSLYFTGTNSAALQGIGEDLAILASSRIGHKLRTGERSSQGGRHLQDNVYAGRGHDGLATALTYAYGRESFLVLDNLDVPTLERIIAHLDNLQENINQLSMDDCMRILDPKSDWPRKVDTVEEARMHVVERLQEWKENIYYQIVRETVPTERRFPVLFGFSGKNHPYFIEPSASREYGSMLSGEVTMGPEVSLRGSGLTDIFVPRAHFDDARTFIENAELSPDTVKIHSIEALVYALRYSDTTAARVLTETVGGVHLANAERQAASLREALNINP